MTDVAIGARARPGLAIPADRAAAREIGDGWVALAAIGTCAALSVALVLLYPDSYQQDGGTHFLFARWAWAHPRNLVDVWGRPLFTFLYSGPAVWWGYRGAKLFTVLIACATAWQTWQLAREYGLERPALVIPLLWFQPSFLLLSSETMTEPLFALLLVSALRLHHAGRRILAALLISASALARPEGFFIDAAWGVWLLLEHRGAKPNLFMRRVGTAALLATFPVLWWLAAFAVTHDKLYIVHNWPANWSATVATYGTGPGLEYYHRRKEIFGPLLVYPFALGIIATFVFRRLGLALGLTLTFFVVLSILRATGLFGSAGYPRYFVCVAPAIALVTLLGWNLAAVGVTAIARAGAGPVIGAVTAAVLAVSAVCAVCYVDDMPWTRDSRLVDAAYRWFEAHPRPVQHYAFSQAYMGIRFGWDPDHRVVFPGPSGQTLAALRAAPAATLVVWDADTGPAFFGGTTADSIAAAGYARLYVVADSMRGRILPHLANGRYIPSVTPWGWGGARVTRVSLLYR